MTDAPEQGPVDEAFRLHYRSILGYAYRMTGDRDEAEDVTSHAFLALAEQHRRGRLPRDTRPWLYRTASNQIISRGRRRKTGLGAVGELWRWLTRRSAEETPRAKAEANLRQEAVRTGLAQLTPEDRQVIVLRYDEELEFGEIAEILGLEEGSVRSRLSRAMQRLRQRLEEDPTHAGS
jgi:RNA polymerase sigma-70 factor (ECF subfamily)